MYGRVKWIEEKPGVCYNVTSDLKKQFASNPDRHVMVHIRKKIQKNMHKTSLICENHMILFYNDMEILLTKSETFYRIETR
jgi:hypothetical protein